jgi:Skp family chaperone for outer membrane proteins
MFPVRYIGVAIVLVLVLVGSFAGTWAYGWLSGSSTIARIGSVAVVDVDAVAKQLGVDAAVERQVKDAETSLNAQLGSFQGALRKQYEDKSKELLAPQDNRAVPAADPAAAKQQLVEIEKKLNQRLLQAQQTARNQFNAYRGNLLQSFRAEVVPVAKKIAKQHGCGIVLTKNEAVLLAFDESHDITSAVVKELRKTQPAAAVAHSEQASSLR